MNGSRVPRPLRVLHVDAGREWRGGERHLLLLAQGLRARGVEPLVAAPPGSPLLQRCKTDGLATAAVTMRGPFDLLAVRRLRRLIATWQPDVVHAHDGRAQTVALAALLGRRRAVPLVVTRRSALRPRGFVRYGPRVARLVAVSEAVRDGLRAWGVPDARITVAHPAVSARAPERPRDWRVECGWTAATVVLGVVGPVTQGANAARLEVLADAFAEAGARPGRSAAQTPRTRDPDPAPPVAVVLLGGPAAGRVTLGRLDAFRAGHVHDVPAALAGLDLLVHPGGAEGPGTAVLEGLALGVPCVAFDIGGLGELVRDGIDGVLVPPDDLAGLAEGVLALARDAGRRARLSAAARARAAHFGVDRMVDTVLTAYRDVLERSGV